MSQRSKTTLYKNSHKVQSMNTTHQGTDDQETDSLFFWTTKTPLQRNNINSSWSLEVNKNKNMQFSIIFEPFSCFLVYAALDMSQNTIPFNLSPIQSTSTLIQFSLVDSIQQFSVIVLEHGKNFPKEQIFTLKMSEYGKILVSFERK